ncbi:MAG: sigma-54-dependent Fis family transcriptional regulator [Chlorobi bacterium]|nr:sigma-54-dependent Fis family transcriptional regulator [Chlorobiota bacterium]
MQKERILVIDDEEFIRSNIKRILSSAGYKVTVLESGTSALDLLKKTEYDLILLDLNLPDIHGLKVLKKIKELNEETLVIIMTGYASVESAVEAIKLGAYDYIKKPFKADAIKLIIKLAIETLSLKKEVKQLKSLQPGNSSLEKLLGTSSAILRVKNQIKEYAKYDSETVLITGESGVGKELIASSIHALSPRAKNELIEVNCASIPENLLESELFGYEKGAFTDATRSKEGILEKAHGGSLFLDEIGEMSLALQAKLLRVIENKKFRRLGSTTDKEVNLRIIAATNRNLEEAIAEKDFRKDLYYRLNVLRIEAPPLRKRGKDILELAEFFLLQYAEKFNKKIDGFSEEAKSLLLNYSWPGNIRELKNVIERISILQNENIISEKHILEEIGYAMENGKNKIKLSIDSDTLNFKDMMEAVETQLITEAFEKSNRNISRTARILQIPRETLRYKLEKFKILEFVYEK